ncbi:MAG: hypothetical protein H7301_07630 [Cryobacterium sp.]|nr:hypothetical protein [Oligoflexia bacterium]
MLKRFGLASLLLSSQFVFAAGDPDYSHLLDSQSTSEEQMAAGLPLTPESGNENAEDLLKSAPSPRELKPSREKSASAETEDPSVKDALAGREETSRIPTPLSRHSIMDATLPSEGNAGVSAKKWDRSIPLYDRENPTRAIDFHGSLAALGNPGIQTDLGPGTEPERVSVKNFGVGYEFEPAALQKMGVFSIGPSLSVYYVDDASITSSAFSIYGLGLNLKYQFKYWRGQAFVPFVGYEAEMIKYSIIDGQSGITTAKGLTFGAMLALNWLEPSAAHNLFSEYGIRRTYLVGEMKQLTAGETLLSTDGTALYFGLRMEY